MITLDQWIATRILKSFQDSANTARKNLNSNIHAMEISNAILSRNVKDKITITEFKKAFFKSNPNAKPYNGENNIKQTLYLDRPGKLLIISPSFSAIQLVLRKISNELNINTLDVGHTAGYGLEERNTVLGFRIRQALTAGEISTEISDKIFDKYDKALSSIHLKYRANLSKSSSLASTLVEKFNFIYTVPQDSYLNRTILGSQEAIVAKNFIRYIEELTDIKTSPSIMQMLFSQLVSAFLGKKVKVEKYNTTKKGSIELNNSVPIKKAKLSSQDAFKDGSNLNLLRLQTLINLRLHDQIRRNMGKGTSSNILNYRTGRFARSAQVDAVIRNRQEFVDIYYTYQRDPYDTFLPGGRLYKPGRDPRKIIGNSIRQLASQFLANNFKANPILEERNEQKTY